MPTRLSGSPAESATGSPRERLRRAAVAGVWWLRAHRFVDRAGSAANTTVLLGSARSGTTWLGVIDRHHDHRILFEPFRPSLVPQLGAFAGVAYLRPEEGTPEQRHQAADLLTGQFRNSWVDHTTAAYVPRRRLLKDVRANCLAPWIAHQFPESPLVLIVRHPLAVARSRQALGWTDSLDAYLDDPALVSDHVSPAQLSLLRALDDPITRYIGQWTLETVIPLRMLNPDRASLVHYEELTTNPLPAASDLLRRIGQEPDDALVAALRKPSRTTGPSGPARPRREHSLTSEERTTIGEVIEAFDLGGTYDLDGAGFDPGVTRAMLAASF